MESFDNPQPAATLRTGESPSVAEQSAAKRGPAPTRLLTPAVQRVIDWHQGRIAAQPAGGVAEAANPARLDPAPHDAVLRS